MNPNSLLDGWKRCKTFGIAGGSSNGEGKLCVYRLAVAIVMGEVFKRSLGNRM